MLPDPPPPSSGRPSGPGTPGKKTLVGGLPWQTEAAPAATPQPREPTPPTPAVASPPAAATPSGPQVARTATADEFSFIPAATAPVEVPLVDVSSGGRKPRARGAPPRAAPPQPPAQAKGLLVDVFGAEEAADLAAMAGRFRDRIEVWVRKSPPFSVSICVHLLLLLLLALFVVNINRERRRPIEISFASLQPVEAEQPGVQIVEAQPEPEPEPEPEVMEEEKPVEDPIAAPVVAEAEAVEALGSEPAEAAAPAVGSLLDGREEGSRKRLVAAYGGSDATEAAVGKALAWLVRQQGKDGLWSLQGPYLDGASQENRLAATAMALLALQGAGNTSRAGVHKRAVAAAWTALLKKQVPGRVPETVDERRKSGAGRFEISLQDPPERQALYAHAQATIALCELYGMTKDPTYEQPARQAVAYAVAAQGPNGGWRYEPGQNGDMSVTGWYMMALKSAEMAGLEVPEQAFVRLGTFLDGVAVEEGRRYGYRFEQVSVAGDAADRELVRNAAGPVTAAVSAEGLLCRQYLGWPRAHPALAPGVEALMNEKFIAWDSDKDVYAWYYITQVAHHLGGPSWDRWNGRMKEVLPATQVATGNEQGSWDPALDKWGPWGGRLYMTCFCTYMLEVYYRHLPLYGVEAVAATQ